MKFYRYFSSHAYETLLEKKLMVSRLSKFNDPFEFLYRSGGVMTIGKAKRYIKDREKSDAFFKEYQKHDPKVNTKRKFKAMMREKRELLAKGFFDSFPDLSVTQPDYRERMADKYFRISCFTKIDTDPFDEILMWSHYANKHFGVRIGFELDNEKRYPYFMKEIIYSRHRVSLDLTTGTDVEKVKSALIEAICTKSAGWRYEREYRFFTTPDLCEERIVNGEAISLIGFDQSNIWTIDFGVKCPDSERRRIAAIAKIQFPGAKIRCAEYHKTDFSLEYSEYK